MFVLKNTAFASVTVLVPCKQILTSKSSCIVHLSSILTVAQEYGCYLCPGTVQTNNKEILGKNPGLGRCYEPHSLKKSEVLKPGSLPYAC